MTFLSDSVLSIRCNSDPLSSIESGSRWKLPTEFHLGRLVSRIHLDTTLYSLREDTKLIVITISLLAVANADPQLPRLQLGGLTVTVRNLLGKSPNRRNAVRHLGN